METDVLIKIRNENLNIVCNYLNSKFTATLPEIADATNLSFPTVKKIITTGIANNLFYQTGETAISGSAGRRANIYQINEKYIHIATLVINTDKLFVRVYNFCKQIVFESETSVSNINALSVIDDAFFNIFSKYESLKSVSIILPAPILNGAVKANFKLPALEGVDFKARYEEKYSTIVNVENDMNILTLSAIKDDNVKNKNSVIASLQYGFSGFGSGTVINGKVFSGFSGYSGEIYNLPLKKDLSTYDKSVEYFVEIAHCIIAILNPEYLFIYVLIDSIDEYSLLQKLKKILPSYSLPHIFIKNTFIEDIFKGTEIYCNDDFKVSL